MCTLIFGALNECDLFRGPVLISVYTRNSYRNFTASSVQQHTIFYFSEPRYWQFRRQKTIYFPKPKI